MALFEYANQVGLLNESLSYNVKSTLKQIKWMYSKNLILKGDIEGLKARLTGLLDNCKDISDIGKLKQQIGIDASAEMLSVLAKQAKNPDKYEKEYPYTIFKSAFEKELIKPSDIENYVRWLKTTYKKMISDKEKELSKKK